LHGGHRPVEARAVVADDREVVAPLEAQLGQAAGERGNVLQDCQMPRSFSRTAILSGRRWPWKNNNRGKVSCDWRADACPADSDMNVSSVFAPVRVARRVFYSCGADARPSGASKLAPTLRSKLCGPAITDR
jgi:hypothetical protein